MVEAKAYLGHRQMQGWVRQSAQALLSQVVAWGGGVWYNSPEGK